MKWKSGRGAREFASSLLGRLEGNISKDSYIDGMSGIMIIRAVPTEIQGLLCVMLAWCFRDHLQATLG